MTIDLDTRCSGHWIVAAQGMGKSNALLCMLAEDLKKDACIIVIDPKGDLSNVLRHIALDRLVVLDPHTPFAINPLDVSKTDVRSSINVLEYIFGVLLEAEVTAKQASLLRSILRSLVLAFPEPTFQTIQDLIIVGPKKYPEQIAQLPPDLQEFYSNEWGSYDSTRSELKWRMRLLLENDLIQKMFSAPKNRFRISELMDRGDVLVVDNAIEHLHEDGSKFLGRYILAQIWHAAMIRVRKKEKKPVYVYVDEADLVIDRTISQIIDRCRSANIGLILSHQRTKQIEDPNVLSALENCAIKMANVDAEAPYFSKLLHIPVERINHLARGHFATHIRGEGASIRNFEKAKLPFRNMTPEEERAHRQRMIELYGYPQTAVPKEAPERAEARDTPGAPEIAEQIRDPSELRKWKPD